MYVASGTGGTILCALHRSLPVLSSALRLPYVGTYYYYYLPPRTRSNAVQEMITPSFPLFAAALGAVLAAVVALAATLLGTFKTAVLGGALVLAAAATWIALRFVMGMSRCRPARSGEISVGFFHPFANTAGGGERVLWTAIKALEEVHLDAQDPRTFRVLVYTGDDPTPGVASPADILKRAEGRFGISFEEGKLPLEFVYLSGRRLVLAETYPRFTLLGQSLGAAALAWEALRKRVPDVWVDSTGYAFTYPVASVAAGCRVATYTHYPTISTDMLRMVFERRPSYNNDEAVAKSAPASAAKFVYYWLFALVYAAAGRFASVVMVNSTWWVFLLFCFVLFCFDRLHHQSPISSLKPCRCYASPPPLFSSSSSSHNHRKQDERPHREPLGRRRCAHCLPSL